MYKDANNGSNFNEYIDLVIVMADINNSQEWFGRVLEHIPTVLGDYNEWLLAKKDSVVYVTPAQNKNFIFIIPSNTI